MKSILRFAAFFLALSCPAWATWTVVQHVLSGACGTTSNTCAVTVASTGSGNVIVVGIGIGSTTQHITAVSAGGTFTIPPSACFSTDTAGKGTDCAYTLSSSSGVTSITVTRSNTSSAAWRVGITELSFTSGPVSVDTGSPQTRDQTVSTTTPAGVALTLAGSNDAVFQIINGVSPTNVSVPYNTASDFGSNAGFATNINTTDGTAPTWTQSNGHAALSAIAFTESAAQSGDQFLLWGVGY